MAVPLSETATGTKLFAKGNAPINVNPVGGSAGKGWGFDKF